jgi:hypothetical protein
VDFRIFNVIILSISGLRHYEADGPPPPVNGASQHSTYQIQVMVSRLFATLNTSLHKFPQTGLLFAI